MKRTGYAVWAYRTSQHGTQAETIAAGAARFGPDERPAVLVLCRSKKDQAALIRKLAGGR